MRIERDKVVTFHYRVTDADGSFTETSEGKAPAVYLHGYANIVPGLENEMRGRQAGEEFQARIAPEHGYGMRDETAVQRVPIKHLIRPGKLVAGQLVAVNTNAGARRGLVPLLEVHEPGDGADDVGEGGAVPPRPRLAESGDGAVHDVGPDGAHRFFVTDTPARFLAVAGRFLGRAVDVAEHVDV